MDTSGRQKALDSKKPALRPVFQRRENGGSGGTRTRNLCRDRAAL